MEERSAPAATDWLIRPGDESPFVYYPPIHSRAYVEALAEYYSPEVADDVLRQAVELERRAQTLGYTLAEDEHGLDEALPSELAPYTPPPDAGVGAREWFQ
jgi:hypothetical protein